MSHLATDGGEKCGLGLFFATVGMQLDPTILFAEPALVALVLAALVIAKPLILVPPVRFTGHTQKRCLVHGHRSGSGWGVALLIVASALGLGVIKRDTCARLRTAAGVFPCGARPKGR